MWNILGPLAALFITSLSLTEGYHTGAPLCLRAPSHGYEPQRGPHGLDIKKEKDGYRIVIVIKSKTTFKGFLLTTDAPGEFEIISHGIQIIPCTGLQGSLGYEYQAVTHTYSDEKRQIKIVFNQDEEALKEPVFYLTLVEDYATYWTNIRV